MHKAVWGRAAAHRVLGVAFGALTSAALLGAAVAAPVVVGQVAPLSGLRAGDAQGYSAGMQMYFNHVNRTGGVSGNTLVLARKDDAGRVDQTLAATEQLLSEQRPLLLAGYMGSSNLAALQKSLDSCLLEHRHTQTLCGLHRDLPAACQKQFHRQD